MPEISRFFGIVITMYYNDHQPPHFHARHGDALAVVEIASGRILAGKLPLRAAALVEEWRERYKSELDHDWTLAESHSQLMAIEPLA